MKKHCITQFTLSLVAVGALACTAIAKEEEKTISIDQVPAPAAAALKKAAGHEKITKIEQDSEDGKVKGYEATFKVNGQRVEVTVTPEGKVESEERVIPLAEAPAPVQEAIKKAAGEQKIGNVEQVKEDGKVRYETVIGKQELEFDESGKLVSKEEKEGKEGKEGKD